LAFGDTGGIFPLGPRDSANVRFPGQFRAAAHRTRTAVGIAIGLEGMNRGAFVLDKGWAFRLMLQRPIRRLTRKLALVVLVLVLGAAACSILQPDVALPAGAKFAMNAATGNGDIDNQFGGGLSEQSEGRGAKLEGSVGDGPDVSLITQHGNITVRKSSGEPNSPKGSGGEPVSAKPRDNIARLAWAAR